MENKNMKNYFVTGIGTNIGKTIVSAILTEALEADYWKPIQAGDLEHSDSLKVESLISNSTTKIHSEAYRLNQSMSPHAAAKLDNITIDLEKIELPKTTNNLIIEGAGGLMVPLNEKELVIDLIKKLNIEVILVSQNYIGSINHTILSYEALKNRKIIIAGIIFNGQENATTEQFILNYTKLHLIARIGQHDCMDKNVILHYKNQLNFHAE